VRRLWRDGRSATGLTMIGLVVFLALLAPWIAPVDPAFQGDILANRFLPPLARDSDGVLHLLGTDHLGRDLWSRLVHGARISLAVGVLSVVVAIALGAAIGLAAAVRGGLVERGLMAVTDAALAMPRIVLLLALVMLWQPSLVLVVLVLGFTGWMSVARLVRAEAKGIMERPFVAAARAAGAGPLRLVGRHVFPNAVTPIIVAAALGVGNAIMLEAGLSFLGLGIPAPAPSWGNMIAGGRDALVNAPWIATFPGLAVALAVVACNLVGDGARDAMDPTTARRQDRRVG
jgi:peptide/nickel transport system permease protein